MAAWRIEKISSYLALAMSIPITTWAVSAQPSASFSSRKGRPAKPVQILRNAEATKKVGRLNPPLALEVDDSDSRNLNALRFRLTNRSNCVQEVYISSDVGSNWEFTTDEPKLAAVLSPGAAEWHAVSLYRLKPGEYVDTGGQFALIRGKQGPQNLGLDFFPNANKSIRYHYHIFIKVVA